MSIESKSANDKIGIVCHETCKRRFSMSSKDGTTKTCGNCGRTFYIIRDGTRVSVEYSPKGTSLRSSWHMWNVYS